MSIRTNPPSPPPPKKKKANKQTKLKKTSVWNFSCVLFQEDRDVSTFDVELVKDSRGLGITIAGYVEQTSPGLFVNIFFWLVFVHAHYMCTLYVSLGYSQTYTAPVSRKFFIKIKMVVTG